MSTTNRIILHVPRILAATLAVAGLAGCVGTPATVQPVEYGYSATCYAGAYMCQLPSQVAVGSQCTCPGLGAPSFGAVR